MFLKYVIASFWHTTIDACIHAPFHTYTYLVLVYVHQWLEAARYLCKQVTRVCFQADAMEPTATSTNGMNRHKKGSAGVEGSLPRRSSRGSGAAARASLVKDANEEEKGDKGNIFDLMKVWKKKEEQKEEAAWVHAVVTLEQKIENGEETEVDSIIV